MLGVVDCIFVAVAFLVFALGFVSPDRSTVLRFRQHVVELGFAKWCQTFPPYPPEIVQDSAGTGLLRNTLTE